jgi:hypothetical protein
MTVLITGGTGKTGSRRSGHDPFASGTVQDRPSWDRTREGGAGMRTRTVVIGAGFVGGLGELAGLAAVVIVGVVVGLGQAALTALPGDSWVQEEAIFGLVGLAAVVMATATLRRPARPGALVG